MEERNSIQIWSVADAPPTRRESSATTEQIFNNIQPIFRGNSEPWNVRGRRYIMKVLKWHVKPCPKNRTLIVFRGISIVLFLVLSIIDIVAYTPTSNSPSSALQFVWAAKYPLYDIATIIYCSGAGVFGISFEIYLFVSLAIANTILQSKNCGDVQLSVVFLARVICLAIAVELAHQNFRRLSEDLEPRENSARGMLHQSLLFSLSILFFAGAGLRTVYDGALNECKFQHFTCGLIDMDAPEFKAHSYCDPSFIEYVSGREELRILRDWLVLNIAFYAIFNHALFETVTRIGIRNWWFCARLSLLTLFLALTTALLVVNIVPFQLHKTKIVFDVIECALFFCTLILMAYNLFRTRPGAMIDGDNEPIEQITHIVPTH